MKLVNKIKRINSDFKLYNRVKKHYCAGRFYLPKPDTLFLVVTNNCNSRCQMCHIWKNHDPQLMTITDYEQLLDDDFFDKIEVCTITGGECFLRNDLDALIAVLKNRLPSLKHINLATNGYLSQKINEFTSQITKKYSDLFFQLQVSLDGFDKVHNQIRGLPDFYERTLATIDNALSLRTNVNNFSLVVNTLIQKQNIKQLERLFTFFQEKKILSLFSPLVFSAEYYENKDQQDELQYSVKDISYLKEFFTKISQQTSQEFKNQYLKVTIPILEKKQRQQRCLMGIDSITVMPNGDVPICINALEHKIGNVFDKNWPQAWFENKRVRKTVEKKICPTCPAACSMSGLTLKQVGEIINENFSKYE